MGTGGDGPFSKRELEDFGEGLGLANLVYRIWSGCPPISPPGDHGLTEVSLGRKLVRFWPEDPQNRREPHCPGFPSFYELTH